MSISDDARYRLHQRLEHVLGPDEAGTLMAHLPPVAWSDIATKQDLLDLRHELKGDIEGLRRDLGGDIDGLRRDIDGLRQGFDGLRRDVAAHESNTARELEHIGLRLQADLAQEMRTQTWRLVTVLVPSIVAVAGLAAAAPHL